ASRSASCAPASARRGERGVDSAQCLLAPEQRDALEDPRRDRRPSQRDPQRLVDLPRLGPEALLDLLQRGPHARLVEALRSCQRGSRLLQRVPTAVVEPALTRLRVQAAGPLEEEPRKWPEVRERLDLLLADRRRARERLAIELACLTGTLALQIRGE